MTRSFVSQRVLTQDDKRKQRTAFSCLVLMPFQVFHAGQFAMNKGVILKRSEESHKMTRSFVSQRTLTQDDKRKQRTAFSCLVLMPFQVFRAGQFAMNKGVILSAAKNLTK